MQDILKSKSGCFASVYAVVQLNIHTEITFSFVNVQNIVKNIQKIALTQMETFFQIKQNIHIGQKLFFHSLLPFCSFAEHFYFNQI